MNSKCRNCKGFGKCGFVAYFPMTIQKCPDYERGQNNGADVYMEKEVKRGRKAKGEFTPKVSTKGRPKKNAPVTPQKIETRVRKILADFPNDFKAKDLKDAYEKKHKTSLVLTKELRDKVCRPYSGGWLINKCKVKRRKSHV
jgi:hypothetical protein